MSFFICGKGMSLLALSLSMVIVTWCHEGNSLTIVGGGVSSVADMADMGVGQRGGHMGHNSDIVGVASSVGIVHREAGSHLVGGVGISLGLSLAIVGSVVNSREGGIGVDGGGIGIAMADSSDNSDIVGVASGVGIVHREASSHLVGGVSLSISLGLSLAIVAGVNSRDGGIGVDSGGMSIHSSVADGADSIDQAMTIVDPSDDPARGGAVGNLAQGVGVTAGAGNKSKNLDMKTL